MNNRKFIFITFAVLIVFISQFLIFAMRETKSQSSDLTSLIPTDSIRIEQKDTIESIGTDVTDLSDTSKSNKDENGADTSYVEYQTGVASWYGDPNGKLDPYHGRRTASGVKFDTYQLWAAHKKLPFGTLIRVTNESNGKSVIVEIVDRGPFVRGRVIDLSWAAKNALDMGGTTKVLLEKVIITEPETQF